MQGCEQWAAAVEQKFVDVDAEEDDMQLYFVIELYCF